MWTPTGNILRTTALLLALGLMLSLVSTGPGTGVQAAETILPSSNILCVCDADKSGSIDRSEAVDGVTSYLVQIEKPGLGRPLTRTEAVTLVTNYLLSLHFECPTEVDPIASWPFEENPAATTTVDISGNGHTGQVTDAVSLPGAKGRAFEFNGSTSVVSVPDGPGLDGMDAMTVQAWVYPKSYPQTSYPHEAGIVSKWGPGGVGDDSWFLTLNGDQHEGKVYFAVGGTNGADNSSIRSTSTVPLNQWSRVTGVFERNKRVSLYINGTLVGSTTAYDLPVHDTSQQLTIGRAHGDGSGPRWFDGCIDEVKVWDVAQVPDAVTPPTTGCQVSDIETFSLGGHPNDITFDGHNVWVTNAPAGKVSKLDLNGNVLLSTSVGQTPMGIDSDGEFVWVSDVNDTKLRKLNPNTGAVVCEVTIASSLNGVLFDGRDIWVANPANNAINKVSTSCQMLGQFSVAGNPDNLGFDGQNVWASGWTSNKVTKIDGFDGSNKGEFDVASKTNETVFDGRHVWVAKDPSATLTKLLASDGQNIGDFAIGSRSYGAASDSVFVFAANYDTGTVSKLSVRDGSLQDTYSVGSMPAAVAIDGRNVWVANGGDGTVSKIKDAADGFDVEDQLGPPKPNISYEQWTRKADMPTMRVRLGATVDRAGQVFVIGGHSSSADLATVEVFDPVGDAWATGTSTPQARSGIGAATGGYGKVFSIGGSFNNGGGSTGLVEAYDQDAGVWSVASSLDHNRYAIRVVTASNGRIYAIGGVTGSNQQGVVFNEEYNPATDTWTTRAPMPTLRWGVGLAATPDGLIYAIGGNRDGCPCQLAAAEVYDVFTDTWTALPPMPSPRGNVRVEVGTNGLIYAMGGQASTGPELPTVEVFDPANSTWSQGVDMPVGRGAGEAVVGFDGRIYVFGGSSDFGSQLESVYEFGPIPTARVVFYSSEHGNTDIFSMNLDGSNRRRLTDSTTCDVQPRLSPDGTMIAYNRACSGQPNEIVVMDPAGNELASWQTTTGDRAQDPAWSPDGRRLAYRCGGTQVCLRDWQGSAPSELLFDAASSGKDAISRFEWSPDGRYLLLSWAASGGRWGIGRIDVPARTAQEFIPHGNPGMVFDARYSPDGMSVVFSRESGGLSTGDVRLADSEGQNEQALVTGIAGAHATDWNENGRIYFYSSNSPDTGDEVYSILSDGAGLRRLTDNAFADQYPDAWVPDVLPIAFQSRWDGNDEIYLMAPDGSHKTRITQNTDDDREPAWSPDGSQIAFQSIRDGNWEIYVMNRDGSGPTNLTNHTGKDERPSWSPDGSQIVFFSNRDGNEEIYKMDADGGNQTNISNNSAHDEGPDWSPDGAKIAFRSERDGDHEIFTMSPSGDPSSVVQLTHNGVQDGPPTWSPDGRMISFDSPSNGNYDVYVMDASGGNLTRLTAETGQDVAPDWSADGSKIIYSSQRQGNWDVFSMNSDGTAKTRLTQDVDFDLYPHWRPVKQPDLTEPKQRIIIQSDRSGDEEVYEIDLQGNVLRRLTDSPGADGSPMYSPDGSRIAFYSDRNGPDREIFVMNRDLSGLRQLTFNDVDDVSPTWCGNDRIAYMFDYNQIHIMNADGSDTRLLISGQAPSCASDGAALLVNQSGNIVTVDPATGVATTLGSGGAAVWSPGGKQIAYDDGKNLFVMDLATKAVTQITNDPATDANPQWSPGPAILFTSHRPGNSDIYMINSDGSGLRNVTVNPARDGQASWWIPPVETKGGFTAAINYPAGSNPFDVRVGDVDGDGDPDVLTGNMDSKDISILFNNGRGVLGAANAYDAGGHVTGISTPNDLDADGDLDVVAALAPPNEMAVVFNDGSGQFAVTSKNSYGPAAKSIAEGDFDRDGDMDVAVPLEPNGFSVFLNDGDGTFTSNGHMSASSGLPYQLAVGDLDGDRDLDIVGAINLSNKIEVFLNDGSGAFSSTSTHPTQTWPRGIVLIDIDLDGDLDVAAANQTSHSVSIFLNNGHGNLGDATHYPTGADPRDLAAGDFDRDGFPDLATANYGGNNVSVLLNRGDATYDPPTNLRVGILPFKLTVADLNGDTWPDIVTGNLNDVSVILNRGGGLRRLGTFAEMLGRDLNHLHPNAGSVQIGDFEYVVSGEIESRGIHTTAIERTNTNTCLSVDGEGLSNGRPIPGWNLTEFDPRSIGTTVAEAVTVDGDPAAVHSGNAAVRINGDFDLGIELDQVCRGIVTADFWFFPRAGNSTNAPVDLWSAVGSQLMALVKDSRDLWVVGAAERPQGFEVGTYDEAKYTRVAITINTETGLFDLSIDGVEVVTQRPVDNADKVAAGIRYVTSHSGSELKGTDSFIDELLISSRPASGTHINSRIDANSSGSITPWEVVGNLPESRDQATVAATGDDIYIIGNHPGTSAVTRVRIESDGTIGARFVESSLNQPRYNGAAFVHENWLWQIGGANQSVDGAVLASTEHAAINADGSLDPWIEGPELNAARTGFALVKTDSHVYVISGVDRNFPRNDVERAKLLPGGGIGPWELLSVVVPARNLPSAALTEGCIFYGGGSTLTSVTRDDVYCLRLTPEGDIAAVTLQSAMTVIRQEPDMFTAGEFVYITGGAGGSGAGLNGWQKTERAPMVRNPESGRIVFKSDRSGNFDIYRLDPNASPPVQLTFATTTDEAPALSPDGTTIAYRCDQQICAMGIDGTEKRTLLASDAMGPAWSPSGDRLAVSIGGRIAVMGADGSSLTELTSGFVDANPSWSPDGMKIVFHRRAGTGQPEDIFIVNSNGSGLAQLTDNGVVNDIRPQWSPEGQRIMFSSDRFGDYELFVMNPDGTNQFRLASTEGDDFMEAISPQGLRLVFSSDKDGDIELYSMNANGTGIQRLTGDPGVDSDADWGVEAQIQQIAFVSDRDGGDNIYLTDPEGINTKRLTYHLKTDVQPEISPDGDRITFMSDRADSNKDIWTMNIDGTNFKRLTTDDGNDEWPAWSPDGKRIAFTSKRVDGGAFEIFAMDAADGGNIQNLTNNPASDSLPDWSPDGLQIAFNSTRDSTEWEIYVMDADGTGQTRLTENGAVDQDPDWSPDGSRIAFLRTGPHSDLDLWVMDSDGANQHSVNDDPGHARSELQPSWSPDGKFIVELMKWPADSNDYEVVKINLETKEITPLTVNSFGEAQPHWGPVAQREGIWRQVSPFGSPPTPVAGASDAFDPATRTWHIFGGHTGSSETGQFWRYDAENNRWDSIIPFGPTPSSRTRGAIVWDDSNNRMLMYGGAPCSGAGTCKKDLWAYTPSDSAWTQLASAPVGRAGAASAWDAKRNRMMVFGGGDGDGTANTLMAYESDADSWTTLTSGPTPRGSYEPNGAVWDTANDRMLLFAGGGVEKLLNELWAYDPNTDQWSQLGPSGSWPPVRAAHSALWDSNTDRMLVFGGNGGSVLGDHNDVWAYSTADNEWVQLVQDQPLPPERRSHVAAWDSKVRRLLIWSGGNPRLSDFWVLQFNGGPE